jgi:hypothetical protein
MAYSIGKCIIAMLQGKYNKKIMAREKHVQNQLEFEFNK